METAGWRARQPGFSGGSAGKATVVYARFLDPVPSELESPCCQA
jgi:hypothetical protein